MQAKIRILERMKEFKIMKIFRQFEKFLIKNKNKKTFKQEREKDSSFCVEIKEHE